MSDVTTAAVVHAQGPNPDITLTTGSDVDKRGISKSTKDGKWEVKLSINGKNTYVNRFANLADAIRCRDEARLRRKARGGKERVAPRREKQFGVRARNDGMKTTYAVEVYHKGKRHYGGVFKTREGAQEKAQALKARLVTGVVPAVPFEQ